MKYKNVGATTCYLEEEFVDEAIKYATTQIPLRHTLGDYISPLEILALHILKANEWI